MEDYQKKIHKFMYNKKTNGNKCGKIIQLDDKLMGNFDDSLHRRYWV